MTISHEAIGKRIRQYRLRRGLSQLELSEMIDCNSSHLSCIESGIKGVSITLVIQVANALDVSVDELVVDNLANPARATDQALLGILEDCDAKERELLIDMVGAIKETLRANKSRNLD